MLFNIAFLNVRSLTNHFAHVKSLLLEEKYDFLGISESWLSDSVSDDRVYVSGYRFVRSDRDSRGGGVGLYVRDGFKFEVVNRNNQACLEQIWVRVRVQKCSYIVGSLYRPPKSKFADFLNVIENTLSEIFISCDELIFGGDLNVNFLDVENKSTQDLISLADTFNLLQVISDPTRVTLKTCSLLDVIFVPNSYTNFRSNTKEVSHISDHLLVFCILNRQDVVSQKTICLRNYKRLDTNLLGDILSVTPFNDILYMRDINDKVTCLNGMILLIFDTLAPIKKFS